MKNLMILMVVLLSVTSQAALFGKYKLELSNGLSGLSGEYVFLMNSNLEVKELEEEGDYYVSTFNVLPFFGEVELSLKWGSDEDHHYFVMNLFNDNGEASLSQSCGVYRDGPNDYVSFDEAYAVLKKWNTKSKKYEVVSVQQSAREADSCRDKLESLLSE